MNFESGQKNRVRLELRPVDSLSPMTCCLPGALDVEKYLSVTEEVHEARLNCCIPVL